MSQTRKDVMDTVLQRMLMEPERFLNKIIDPFSKPTQSLTASRVRNNFIDDFLHSS